MPGAAKACRTIGPMIRQAMSERLYLDNAATSFPKPPCVWEAAIHYATQVGASPGRGGYAEAVEGGRLLHRCRERINTLIHGESPDHVVFALNTTDALNMAIRGVVRHRQHTPPNEPIHLITTDLDHNSVLRPFNSLAAEGVEWTCIACDPETGLVDPADVAAAIRPTTALVAVVHASNVTGTVQPVGAIGKICRERGVLFLVDAAQSVGHMPVDVQELCIDLLAFPGHKGLLGPAGTGALYLRPGVEQLIATTREGGTGTVSEQDTQPETMPDKYEAGSHNTVGLIGLSEGVGWILERGTETIFEHERQLVGLMIDRLADKDCFPGLRLIGPRTRADRVGVFSVVHESLLPHELAGMLETSFGILVRAGLHCAPRAHGLFGTTAQAGATRLSFGAFNTEADIERACSALSEICKACVAV